MAHGLFGILGMRNGFIDLFLALGLAFAALSGSQVYSFGPLLSTILTIPVSETQLNVCKGLATVGLQLTLFAGLVLDKFGPKLTLAIGLVGNVGCWVGLSFLPATESAWVGLLLLLVLGELLLLSFVQTSHLFAPASFSQGFLFLACFKTSMQMHATGGGVAMGLVSATMSLSLAAAIFSSNLAGCTGTECWRLYDTLCLRLDVCFHVFLSQLLQNLCCGSSSVWLGGIWRFVFVQGEKLSLAAAKGLGRAKASLRGEQRRRDGQIRSDDVDRTR